MFVYMLNLIKTCILNLFKKKFQHKKYSISFEEKFGRSIQPNVQYACLMT